MRCKCGVCWEKKKKISGVVFVLFCLWAAQFYRFCSTTEFKSLLCYECFCGWAGKACVNQTKEKGLGYLLRENRSRTHGKDNDPQYTLPYSDTLAGSPEWRHTFHRLDSSCHKSSSRSKALRSQQDSGMWAYLNKGREVSGKHERLKAACKLNIQYPLVLIAGKISTNALLIWLAIVQIQKIYIIL